MAKRNIKCNFNLDYSTNGNKISQNTDTSFVVVMRYIITSLVLFIVAAVIVLLITINIKTLPFTSK